MEKEHQDLSTTCANDILKLLKYIKRGKISGETLKNFPLDKMIQEVSHLCETINPRKEVDERPLIMRLEDCGSDLRGMVGDIRVVFDTYQSTDRWYFYLSRDQDDLRHNSLWQSKHYPSLESCVDEAEKWIKVNA